ncbi:hypothetical protein GCM10007385_45100 [Tateyamaria omphalii]|nr:hypothetical protein GCM10007385_45100 [Tateyamaria omphalii]
MPRCGAVFHDAERFFECPIKARSIVFEYEPPSMFHQDRMNVWKTDTCID